MANDKLAIDGGSPVIAAGEHVKWPVITDADRAAVMRVLDRGVLSGPFAPEVRALEQAFAGYVGARHCLATNSGTAALHLALAAAGVGPGDEVITPAYSFVATGLSVLHQNAIPVFVDIEPQTCGIDPALIEAAITPRTKAILPVHIHGTPCDLQPILDIAKRHGLIVIEDAAQAHGAEYHGRKVGSIGALGCFSTQSSKTLSCGEGGLVVTSDDELWERAGRTRAFGENLSKGDEAAYRIERALDGNRAYDSLGMGWMYRTNEMSAALANSQLARLPAMIDNAQKNAELLSARLADLPGITPPVVPAGRTSCYHKYRIRLDAEKLGGGIKAPPRQVRDAFLRALCAEGVEAVLWQTLPVPGQTLFRKQAGYGGGVPWSLGKGQISYDLAQYPETNKLLDSSIVLFSQTYPIAPQPRALCEAYAEAVAKVWRRLDEVLALAEKAADRRS
jgi:dTDP-4-amino-4,6-dideoxygalactose transaminase